MARVLVVALALAAAGCLQAAPDPLSPEPEAALDRGVLGSWRCVSPGDDTPLRLEVAETAPRRYRLHFDGADDDDAVFAGHASVVGGRTVLNVQEQDEDPEGWYFAVLALHGQDVLEVRYVELEEVPPPPREQVEAALASGRGLAQACACVPLRPE